MSSAGRKGEFWETPKILRVYLYEIGANVYLEDRNNFKLTPLSISIGLGLEDSYVSTRLKEISKKGEKKYCEKVDVSIDQSIGTMKRRKRTIFLLNEVGINDAKNLLSLLKNETIKYVKNEDEVSNTVSEVYDTIQTELKNQNRFITYSILAQFINLNEPVKWESIISKIPFECDLLYPFKMDGKYISFKEFLMNDMAAQKIISELYYLDDSIIPNKIESFIPLIFSIKKMEEQFHIKDSENIKYMDIEHKINRNFNICINGGAGTGKTALLRMINHNLLKNQSSRKIPIYLPLKHYKHDSIDDFIESMILEKISDENILNNFEFFKSKGQICFLFDGFDELRNDKEAFENDIESFFINNCKSLGNNFVITSRDNIDSKIIKNILTIDELNDTQRNEFLLHLFRTENYTYRKLVNKIHLDPYLNKSTKNPLILTIISALIKIQSIDTIDNLSRFDIYEEFINELFSRKKSKKKESGKNVAIPTLKNIVGKIAFHMTKNEITEISLSDLIKILIEDFPNQDINDFIIKELTEKIGIIVKNKHCSFLHKSFQEFLTAKYMIQKLENPAATFANPKVIDKIDWWLPIIDFYSEQKPCNQLILKINELPEDILFTKLHLISHIMISGDIEPGLKKKIENNFIENYYDLSIIEKRSSNLKSIQEIARIIIRDSKNPDVDVSRLYSTIPEKFWNNLNKNIWYEFLHGLPLEIVIMAINKGHEKAYTDFTLRASFTYQYYKDQLRKSSIDKINMTIVEMIKKSYRNDEEEEFRRLTWSAFSCSIYDRDLQQKLVNLIFSFVEQNEFHPKNNQDKFLINRILLPLFQKEPEYKLSHNGKSRLIELLMNNEIEIGTRSSISRILRYIGESIEDFNVDGIDIPEEYLGDVFDIYFLLWSIGNLENGEEKQNAISYLMDKRHNPLLKLKDRIIIIPIVDYISHLIEKEENILMRNLLIGLLESFDNLIIYDYLVKLYNIHKNNTEWNVLPKENLIRTGYDSMFFLFRDFDKLTSKQLIAGMLVSAKGIYLIQKQKQLAMTFTDSEDPYIRVKAFEILFYGETEKRHFLIQRILETKTPFRCQIINRKVKCVSSSYYPYPIKFNLHIGEPHDNLSELLSFLLHLYQNTSSEYVKERISDICIMIPEERTLFALEEIIRRKDSFKEFPMAFDYVYYYIEHGYSFDNDFQNKIKNYIGHLLENVSIRDNDKSKEILEVLFQISKIFNIRLDIKHIFEISTILENYKDIQQIILQKFTLKEIFILLTYILENIDNYSVSEILKGIEIIKYGNTVFNWKNDKLIIKIIDKYINLAINQIKDIQDIYNNEILWTIDLSFIEKRFINEVNEDIKFILLVPLWYRSNINDKKNIAKIIIEDWKPIYSDIIWYNYPDSPSLKKLSDDIQYNSLFETIWGKHPESQKYLMYSIFHPHHFIETYEQHNENIIKNEILMSGLLSLSRYTIDRKNNKVKNEGIMEKNAINKKIENILQNYLDSSIDPVISTYALICTHLYGRKSFIKALKKYINKIPNNIKNDLINNQPVFTCGSYEKVNLTVILDYYIKQGELSIIEDYMLLIDKKIIQGTLGKDHKYQPLMHKLYEHYQDVIKIGQALIPYPELHEAYLYNFKTDYWNKNASKKERIFPSDVGAKLIDYDLSRDVE